MIINVLKVISAVATLSMPVAAAAEPLAGIRFDLIPVGCRIHGVYSDGSVSIDEYIGKRAGRHVVKTFGGVGGRALLRTTQFNPQGWMVKKVWAAGQWETFAPYSCFSQPGKCTYRYANSDGAQETYQGEVRPKGGDLVSSGGYAGQPAFSPTRLQLDAWNITKSYREGSTSYRLTKYQNCGSNLPVG